MGLSRIKIKDIVAVSDERNVEDKDYPFYGINIFKEFMPSVANTQSVDRKKYKVIRKNRFVFSGMQTGRDDCIRIGMYDRDDPVLVSPAYTTFEVTNAKVLPTYFFMIFRSKEMDRYGSFLSDSSVRANLDWDRFCDIELEIPSLDIQKKYVAIYEGLLANLRSYEKGLNDLKLVCDGHIEDLRKKWPMTDIGSFLELVDERNENLEFGADDVKGISTSKCFISTKANLSDVNLSGYKVVDVHQFAYVADTSRRGDKIALAYCDDKACIISSIYTVFKVKDENKLLSRYLMMFFNRPEFDRYARFNSWGSARETFDWDVFGTYRIPVAPIEIQKSICLVYETYLKRKKCLEELKVEINSICPILIKGSFEKDA